MRHAVDLEFADEDVAHLDGMVDQFRVIVGHVGAERILLGVERPHRRRHAPVAANVVRRHEFEAALAICLADDRREHAGAVEEAVRRVEMRTADIQVIGVYRKPTGSPSAVAAISTTFFARSRIM